MYDFLTSHMWITYSITAAALFIALLRTKLLHNLKPIIIEGSRIPAFLSNFAPLTIGAITVFPFVITRAPKGTMTDTTRRHETIHFHQTMELLIVGMLVIYLYDWIKGKIKYRNDWESDVTPRGYKYESAGNKAYYKIRAEQEAYANENVEGYLANRSRWQWVRKYNV